MFWPACPLQFEMKHWITRWFRPLAVTIICALAHTVEAQTNRANEIEYASPDQSVWSTKLNERGEPDNPLLSLATALFTKANIPWRSQIYPASRLFKNLQDGSSQFSILVKVPALQECCLWSKKPVTSVEIRVYRLNHKSAIKTPDDLTGKTVITIRGYSYGGLRNFINDEKNRITNNESPTHAAAFKMLTSGRADYLIDYAGPAAEILASEAATGIQSDALLRQDVHLVLSKTYPDAAKVMAQLESIANGLDSAAIIKNHGK
jgi:ABC-type amino acid transport substrate-binding protein